MTPNYFRFVRINNEPGDSPATYTYALDFNRTQHDASGSIGTFDTWNKLIGTRAPSSLVSAPMFTHADHRIYVSSGSYWNNNLWDSNDGAFTLSCWAYRGGNSENPYQYPRLLAWGEYGGEQSIYLGQYADGGIIQWTTNYDSEVSYQWAAHLTPYAWSHIVIKGKSAADGADVIPPVLFINGVSASYSNSPGTPVGDREIDPSHFVLGGTGHGSNDTAKNHAIRDLGVWNTIISDDEAIQLYNSGSIPNGYDTLSSKQSLCRLYLPMTGAVSGPYWGDYGNNAAHMEIGTSTYWNNNLSPSSNNGDFTLMAWFHTSQTEGSNNSRLMSWGTWHSDGNGADDFGINYMKNTGKVSLQMAFDETNTYWPTTNAAISVGKWHHVVVTGRRGSTYANSVAVAPKIYIDGVQVSVDTPTNIANSDTIEPINHQLYVGQNEMGTEQFDYLSVREMGVWNKILTSAEVTTAYNNGQFRDNSTIQNSSCKGYWRFNEPTADSAYLNLDGTADNVKSDSTDLSKFYRRELFGGMNRGKYSISFWANANWSSNTNSGDRIIEIGNSLFVYPDADDGLYLAQQYGASGTSPSANKLRQYYWDGVATDNTWQHFTFVFDAGKTANDAVTPTLYVNGVVQSSPTTTADQIGSDATYLEYVPDITNENKGLFIGDAWWGSRDFHGKIKEMALWNRLLTSSEVTSLYNSGTPANAKTVQSEDLIAYYPFYSFDDKSIMQCALTRTNQAVIEGLTYTDSMSQNNAACTKIHHKEDIDSFGTYRDLSDSILTPDMTRTASNLGNIHVKRDAYTVMAWVKIPTETVNGSSGAIVDFSRAKADTDGNSDTNFLYENGFFIWGDKVFSSTANQNGDWSQVYSDADSYTFGEWVHVAQVVYPYSATKSVQFYINGVKYDQNGTWDASSRINYDGVGQNVIYPYEDGDHAFTQVLVGMGYGGNEQTYPDRELKGQLSELAIYQGALTHQEISGAYNDGNFISYPSGSSAYDVRNIVTSSCDSWNLVGYWRMGDNGSDPSGQITDESGQGNNLIYSSATVQVTSSS